MLHSEANELRRVGDGGVPRRRVAHRHDAHLGRHTVQIFESPGHGVVGHGTPECRGDRDLRRGLRRKRGRLRVEQNFVNRRQLTEESQECNQFRCRRRSNCAVKQLRLELACAGKERGLLPASDPAQNIGSHLPGAGSGPGVGVRGGIGGMQEVRLETQRMR